MINKRTETVRCFWIFICCLFFFQQAQAAPRTYPRRQLIRLVNQYYQDMRALLPDTVETNIYSKSFTQIPKRNYLLLTIPNMIRVARHGETELFREIYGRYQATHQGFKEKQLYLLQTNIYKKRKPLDKINDYLTPHIYRTTLVENYLLSPIKQGNQHYYIYHNQVRSDGLVELSYKPRFKNTQLVKGSAIINPKTGQILEYTFSGEHDMLRFRIHTVHGTQGYETIIPKTTEAQVELLYLGNRMEISAYSATGMGVQLPDSLVRSDDKTLMEKVRPTPLTPAEAAVLYPEYQQTTAIESTADSSMVIAATSAGKHHRHAFRRFMWNIVGKAMLHRLRFNFGKDNQGSVRLGPLFNPFYFGYSKRKGLVYRSKFNINYTFDEDHSLSMRAKVGYSFKQHQVYTDIPIRFQFNKEHDGFVQLNLQSGNRITSSELLEKLKQEDSRDSINFNKYHLHYFRDLQARLYGNYRLHSRIGLQGGLAFYRRSAVDPGRLEELNRETVYKTFAPYIKVEYKPWGQRGMVLTGNYEHAFKGVFNSNITYDRWEFDASYKKPMSCMREFSFRTGMGFYTHKGDDEYFLDYENFRNNYIIGGWHDDWIGEFELLDANWYNASDYYVRCNTSYESPLLLMSFAPWIGQFIEKERVYVSALAVRSYYPYIECGYAFTNHLFSMGLFTSFSHRKYEGFGVKFNIELFDDW